MDVMLGLSERKDADSEQPADVSARPSFLRNLQAASTRRVLLLTALGGC